ncbi:MAG: MFS transporter [Deltaproteobacteria bacterium]|nr:MFS transporter [Deltaproteobacteria bacterium]
MKVEIVGGLVAASLVVAAIAIGSGGLRHFDPALTHYAFASVIAAFAVAYRYGGWLGRPPTRRLLRRVLELALERGFARQGAHAAGLAAARLGAQSFIARRSRLRWVTHFCLSWGSMLAFAITFPLVFGWVHFETAPTEAETYRAVLFGIVLDDFSVHSWKAFAAFNALNLSAILVLVGVALALYRRLREAGDFAVQQLAVDILPLVLLFAVSATGLLLTISSRALGGGGYPFFAVTHAATVIALLLYLPFGKLFHAVQRPAHVGIGLYKRAAASGAAARCVRCGAAFASAMQVADLKHVLGALAIEPRFADGLHYQDVCPGCRRRLLALNQGRLVGR